MHLMRTHLEIDAKLAGKAMAAGPCTTKQDAVEAGSKLLARQAAYRGRAGVPVRSGIDVGVATFRIHPDDLRLHRNRDFQAFEQLRGLRGWPH